MFGPTKSLQSRVIELLAPESRITENVAVLGRDSRKQSVDWRAMKRDLRWRPEVVWRSSDNFLSLPGSHWERQNDRHCLTWEVHGHGVK